MVCRINQKVADLGLFGFENYRRGNESKPTQCLQTFAVFLDSKFGSLVTDRTLQSLQNAATSKKIVIARCPILLPKKSVDVFSHERCANLTTLPLQECLQPLLCNGAPILRVNRHTLKLPN